MIFRWRRPISVSVVPVMMSLDVSTPMAVPVISIMNISTTQLELNTAVMKTDWEQEEEENEGDHKTCSCLVLVHQGVCVIAVVGVPGPVQDHHPKGTGHEHNDE